MASRGNGDSAPSLIPLPPGMDARWLAREGVSILLNGGVQNAEQLFKKFQCSSPVLSAGASLCDFLIASMTFEDEKMNQAIDSLKRTEKLCNVDDLYEGVLSKRPTDKFTFEERVERMIIWADCELFLAFLMSLRQSKGPAKVDPGILDSERLDKIQKKIDVFNDLLVKHQQKNSEENVEMPLGFQKAEPFVGPYTQCMVDFVKAGYYMRRAWKMYERCKAEISQVIVVENGVTTTNKSTSPQKQKSPSQSSNVFHASAEVISSLDAALSFGYGLIQLAISIVPSGLLKVCELLGFQADRNVGLVALQKCSNSNDMKAPIARLTLLWYHTVVRPFCALDGNNIELGLNEASTILDESKEQYPNSGIFLYFRALILRLRGQLDEALVLLEDVMKRSEDQREIALLCHYDQGWCRMMRLEWVLAAPSFSRLKTDSRWSEAYYTYLLAVNEGAAGKETDALHYLRLVPKLVKRKTQLEVYLVRKANLFKKTIPSQLEYSVLAFELLYLWNALPQCSEDTLNGILQTLDKCSNSGMLPMKLLISGAIHAILKNGEVALQFFQVASSKHDGKAIDPHVIPFATYEIGMLYLSKNETMEKGKAIMNKIRDNHSGYDFENRLNFRIHAAQCTYD